MGTEEQDRRRFLKQQLQWCKEQDCIMGRIEMKLREMKKIAQYALGHELSALEIEQLNAQLNELKNEVHFLQEQLHFVVH